MQKTQELLLILSNEERDAAEEFILRQLKLLDVESLPRLELVGASARAVLEQIRQGSSKLDSSSRAGKMFARIYSSALEGFAHLIRECNLTTSQKRKEVPAADGEGESDDGESGLGGLEVEIEQENEEHALSVIETSIAQMDTAEIRELRDATEELLGWWQTDTGLQESLHLYQWGDVNTAGGRMAIRQAREDLQQEEIAPFRSFYQTINLIYQKKNQEEQIVLRQKRLRQEAGLGE